VPSSDPPVSGARPKKAPREGNIARGLPSIDEARAQRKKLQWMPLRFWKWAALCIGAGIILWWKLEEGKINTMRNDLLARQRAVTQELGPRWFPLRDKVEKWTTVCGAEAFIEKRAPDLAKEWDFRSMNGIYLRLAKEDAKQPATIRQAAQRSLHDGFTSCLLLVNNPNPLAGAKCETTQDCPAGQLCNDYMHCAEHSQPYNLRLAYRTMHVMTDEWVAEIQDISNKLTIRGAMATFDATNKYDLPVATELLQRAKYFMVVVDEEVAADEGRVDEALPEVADAGAQDDRAIPTASHPARVCVWRLEDDAQMLALRGQAAGTLVGSHDNLDLATRIARQRQANSCALALDVREAIGAKAGAQVPEPDDHGSGGAGGAAADAGAPGGSGG
jgi:hypothetical protein